MSKQHTAMLRTALEEGSGSDSHCRGSPATADQDARAQQRAGIKEHTVRGSPLRE